MENVLSQHWFSPTQEVLQIAEKFSQSWLAASHTKSTIGQ